MLQLGPALAVTLAPLVRTENLSAERALRVISATRAVQAVQLNAALPGMRPRELDRTARRDLSAALARNTLVAAGIDLLIPRDHWTEPAHQDRAVHAALAACQLAADLGHVPLALALPVQDLAPDVADALLTAADAQQTPIAIHAEDQLDALVGFIDEHDQPMLRAALDPAALIALREDPAQVAARLGDRLALSRLDDFDPALVGAEGGRRPLGRGKLDLAALRISLSLAKNLRALVLDLRDLEKPSEALQSGLEAWQAASPQL